MLHKITKKQWTLIILGVLAIIFIIFVLPVSIPLITALFTALILNPFIIFISRKLKLTRLISVIIVFLLFTLIMGFSSTFLVTKVIAQVVNFVADIPSHISQLYFIFQKWKMDFYQYTEGLPPEFIRQLTLSIEENLIALGTTINNIFTIENIAQIIAKIPQYFISFIVYLIALFLFMLELPRIKLSFYNMLTEKTAKKVSFMYHRLVQVFLGFMKAQLLVSIVVFITSLIGLFIIAPDIALIMSLIIWVIDIIPIIGSIIILGPWAIYMFLAGNTMMGINLTVLALVILAVRRIVEPKLMGEQIGLSPLATLIAMFLGLKLFGFLGFILGPLIVIIYTSAKEAEIIKWQIKI